MNSWDYCLVVASANKFGKQKIPASKRGDEGYIQGGTEQQDRRISALFPFVLTIGNQIIDHGRIIQSRCVAKIGKLVFGNFGDTSTLNDPTVVDESPRLENSSSAILRKMRRMILPERVFGKPGAN